MNKAFTLHIFAPDGNPDGLRIIERSNWTGKALMFPRALYPYVRDRVEFNLIGVYLLIGPCIDSDGEMLYIGEGDPVRPRLETHYAKKDFWTSAVFFIAGEGQLNKAHIKYLEAQMINRAREAKRMSLDNSNTPSEPSLSESDRAYMDIFLHNILDTLPVLGIHAFMPRTSSEMERTIPILTCKGRGVSAMGYDSSQGFIIKSGSYATSNETPSLKKHCPNVCELRTSLLKNGILIQEGSKLEFTQDYTFNSPSLAAEVVLGNSSNGRTAWKDKNGRTLKEIQQALVNPNSLKKSSEFPEG